MKRAFRKLILAMLIAGIAPAAFGQSQEEQAKGSISGNVTIGGKAAPGVVVTITEAPVESAMNMAKMFEGKLVIKTTTNDEGHYNFAGVTPGRYSRIHLHAGDGRARE